LAGCGQNRVAGTECTIVAGVPQNQGKGVLDGGKVGGFVESGLSRANAVTYLLGDVHNNVVEG